MSLTTEISKRVARPLYLSSGFLICALLVGGLAVWFYVYGSDTPRFRVPLPDITTANVNVASLTNERFEQVQLNPRSAEAWGEYGEVLMAHEWNTEAIECFEVASKLEPTEMRWLYLAGVMLDRRDPAEAVVKYEAAKRLDASYAPLHMRLGADLQRLNRLEEAEVAYQQAARLSPQHPQPLIALARVRANRNQWQSAVELLEEATKIAPTNREALVELTRAKLVLGTLQSLGPEAQGALMSDDKFQAMPDSNGTGLREKAPWVVQAKQYSSIKGISIVRMHFECQAMG